MIEPFSTQQLAPTTPAAPPHRTASEEGGFERHLVQARETQRDARSPEQHAAEQGRPPTPQGGQASNRSTGHGAGGDEHADADRQAAEPVARKDHHARPQPSELSQGGRPLEPKATIPADPCLATDSVGSGLPDGAALEESSDERVGSAAVESDSVPTIDRPAAAVPDSSLVGTDPGTVASPAGTLADQFARFGLLTVESNNPSSAPGEDAASAEPTTSIEVPAGATRAARSALARSPGPPPGTDPQAATPDAKALSIEVAADQSSQASLHDAAQPAASTAPLPASPSMSPPAWLADRLIASPPAAGVQAAPAPFTAAIPVPVTDPGFGAALTGSLDQLLLHGAKSAELFVSPRALGPIRIELSISGETASVVFSAAQPETRTAIEQSLPMLQTLLARHGLTLGDTSVQQQARGEGEPSSAGTGGSSTEADLQEGTERALPSTRIPLGGRLLVDLYA